MDNLFSGLRAALFDLDGTLIETHIDFDLMRSEVVRLAEAYGLEVAPPRDILTGVAALQSQLTEIGRGADAERFRVDAFSLLQEIEVRQCGSPVEVAGAARLLEALEQRGIAVGIVTRNCRSVAERLLEAGRLSCRCLLTRDDVPRTKPHPSHLLAALEVIESGACDPTRSVPSVRSVNFVPERPDCLMVGDHYMDIQAGRAAGMRTAGVLRGNPRSHFEACTPDVIVESPSELLAMLERLP